MKAVPQLPHGYDKLGDIRLVKNTDLLVALNLLAIPLFVGSGWLFISAVRWFVPGFTLPDEYMLDFRALLTLLGAFVGIIVGVILLHEMVHGVFFWLFSGQRPVFGMHWTYVYAAAPGWYFPRWQYLIVGLAPLVLISLSGVLLLPLLPYAALPGVVLALVINATGAIGDIYITGCLLCKPRHLLVLDQKDQITWYGLSLAPADGVKSAV
ncbi:MAG TPA: DUF3267 domain-containing protein [Ktedonobacteraceae bacterium]